MSLVKVSVENIDSNDKTLHEIDMNKTFEENLKSICDIFQKPYTPSLYGLKVLRTNKGAGLHFFISVDNFNEIKDGYDLKLVYSLNQYVKRIFEHISDQFKERSFQDLYELSIDPQFIKEIVKLDKHLVVMDIFTNTKDLTETEATACLITIVHLFQKLYITEIDEDFLNTVISYVKKSQSHELKKFALSVIHKILAHRDPNFFKWKEETIRKITVSDMMEFVKNKQAPEVQYGAILVINSLIKCCKGEKRQQFVKEIDKKSNREIIYEHVIVRGKIDKSLARELYICQTHLLSLLSEALTSVVPVEDILNEFEPLEDDVKKMTVLMDFDENTPKNKAPSVDNLLQLDDDVRISLASMSSKHSEDSRYSSRIFSTITNESIDNENLRPCLLTIEALRHYKKHHPKSFRQTQIEEHIYSPGIVTSSERVIKMLAKILHVGIEPDRSSICYQPTIFTCSSKSPFFFELFSRTMWLLSKTRREMKASTLLDYDKVIRVLSKQVKLVLEKKVMDLKKLTDEFLSISYETVMEIWQKEKEDELKYTLENNASVKILKDRYSLQNQEVIYRQRIKYITNGTLFPKFIDKKINGNFYAKLSPNERHLMINDHNVALGKSGEVKMYSLADVTHIVEGKACPHVQNHAVKEPSLAFSIIVNNDQWINFKAADRKIAGYWLDALNLLIGKPHRSTYYDKEMNDLVEMDLILHLIELQNVPIPKRPPPVPSQYPTDVKPQIPPKPQLTIKHGIK